VLLLDTDLLAENQSRLSFRGKTQSHAHRCQPEEVVSDLKCFTGITPLRAQITKWKPELLVLLQLLHPANVWVRPDRKKRSSHTVNLNYISQPLGTLCLRVPVVQLHQLSNQLWSSSLWLSYQIEGSQKEQQRWHFFSKAVAAESGSWSTDWSFPLCTEGIEK